MTVSPTTVNVADTISTGTITLSTGAGCTWAAASNAGWLTITSATSGTGPATVTFRAGRNNQNRSRIATLTIGGQTVTITQAAAGTPKKPKGVRVVT
jgi:hypothetical protein